MVSILSSIIIWGSILIIAVRILSNSGIELGGSGAAEFLTADKGLGGRYKTSAKETAAVFGVAFLFRVIVFVISIFAVYLFQDNFSFKDMLNKYLVWDAQNYQRIATVGYSGFDVNGDNLLLVFFPLYPWLIRVVNLILRNDIVSGLIISWLMYSGACCYMYKLFSLDYNKATVFRALMYISVFPHSLFFGVMMNESMLLFTMCAALYYIRTHNWLMTGIFGALAALSRMVGILLAIPAAVEWLEEYRIFEKLKRLEIREVWRLFWSKGLWIFLMLAGTGIYLLCNYKVTGDWFKFLEYQRTYWYHGPTYFGKGIEIIFNRMLSEKTFVKFAIWIPQIVSLTAAAAALIYGIRRHRSMYTAFLAIYIIINTNLDWIISLGRYMSCAVPLFIILADFSERHKWTEPLITASMAIAFGVFFVAYFMSRQIL